MSLEQEFEFYKQNQKNLLNSYEGKFLVVKDLEVKGAYGSQIEAYEEGKKQFELGTFLIQQCLPGEDSYTQTYHSRVIFV